MFASKPASAHDKPWWIYGAGTVSCMEWSGHANDTLAYHIHLSWVLGYISAANEFVRPKKSDRYAVETGVTGYCKNRPTATLREATYAVGLFLMKQAATDETPQASPQNKAKGLLTSARLKLR